MSFLHWFEQFHVHAPMTIAALQQKMESRIKRVVRFLVRIFLLLFWITGFLIISVECTFKDTFNDTLILDRIKEIESTKEKGRQKILLAKQEELDKLKAKYSTQDKVSRASGFIAAIAVASLYLLFMSADLGKFYNHVDKLRQEKNQKQHITSQRSRKLGKCQENEMQIDRVTEINQHKSFELYILLNKLRARN